MILLIYYGEIVLHCIVMSDQRDLVNEHDMIRRPSLLDDSCMYMQNTLLPLYLNVMGFEENEVKNYYLLIIIIKKKLKFVLEQLVKKKRRIQRVHHLQ